MRALRGGNIKIKIMKNKARVTYNKIVNISEDGEITVLSDIFMYRDGFKGATGNRFYPVSKKQYKKMTTLSAIEDNLRSCICENEMPCEYIDYKNPYRKWAKEIKDNGEAKEFMFDTSYCGLWDSLRDELGMTEDEAYIFECVGGGRMFDENFQGNYNRHLSKIIRKYENS